MYTSHGYQIPGTTVDGPSPVKGYCGGPSQCKYCREEAITFGPLDNQRLFPESKVKSIPITINGEIVGIARLKDNGFLEIEIGQGPANDELKRMIRDDELIELGLDSCLRRPAVPANQ